MIYRDISLFLIIFAKDIFYKNDTGRIEICSSVRFSHHRGTLQVPESVAGREPFAQLAKLMEVTGGMGWFYDQRPGEPKLGSFFRDH